MFEQAIELNEEDDVEDKMGSSNGHSLDLSTTVETDITKSSPNRRRRRRSFSFASSSKGSLSVHSWPQAGIGLRRAFLISRRGGPSTPVPSWKVSDNSALNDLSKHHHHRHLHPKLDHTVEELHISARKLAAALWELQKLPFSSGKETLGQEPQDMSSNASPAKQPSTLHGRSLSPASSRISKGSHTRPPLVYMKLGDHGKTQVRLERRNGQQVIAVAAASKKEIIGNERATSPAESMVLSSRAAALSNLGCGATTTSELLKLLNHVWSLEEQHASSMSLVGALRTELEDAQAQLQELLSSEMSRRKEVENISKRIAEERSLLQDQQEQSIMTAVQSVRLELENERKSKQKLEMLHKKLAREFRDSKKSIARAMEDLARERKARQLMEEVCDELAREIGEDKTRVEELKRESVKVREEVEEERKMLQMAEVWREERVQMKLMEAKLELEEKNTALDKLRGQLEAFLETKRACEEAKDGGQGPAMHDGRLDVGRRSVDMVVGRNLLDPFHSRDQTVVMSGRNSIDLSSGYGMKQHGWARNSGNDDDDDDLHSIELNCDALAKTATTGEWGSHSFQQHPAEYQERQRPDEVVLMASDESPQDHHFDFEGSNPSEGVKRPRNTQRGRKGRQEAKAEAVAPVGVSHTWIRHNVEGSEKREQSSKSWQSETEDSRSRVSWSPKVMSRSIEGQSESIMRAARGGARVDRKALKSGGERQQLVYNHGGWQPSLLDGPLANYGSNRVSSPTRMWNNHMPPPDFKSKFSKEALHDSNSLKTKLLEAKLEGQQRAEQKGQ